MPYNCVTVASMCWIIPNAVVLWYCLCCDRIWRKSVAEGREVNWCHIPAPPRLLKSRRDTPVCWAPPVWNGCAQQQPWEAGGGGDAHTGRCFSINIWFLKHRCAHQWLRLGLCRSLEASASVSACSMDPFFNLVKAWSTTPGLKSRGLSPLQPHGLTLRLGTWPFIMPPGLLPWAFWPRPRSSFNRRERAVLPPKI